MDKKQLLHKKWWILHFLMKENIHSVGLNCNWVQIQICFDRLF